MGRRWKTAAVLWIRRHLRDRRPRLGQVLGDRTNNFDLIRLGAASLVIYGHSFFEAPDDSSIDVIQWALGDAEYSGSIAVYVFFLISGMLITASMEKHRSAFAFVTLRFARIWPGFAVCTAVLIFAVVPLASGIAPRDVTWLKAATGCWHRDTLFFVRDVCGSLPGAFPATRNPTAFGFSWWTLPAEVHCYAMVLGLGVLLRARFSTGGRESARFCIATLVLLGAFLLATRYAPANDARFHAEFVVMGGYATYPVLFFFAGMLLYALRHHVPIDGTVALALLGTALVLPQPNPLVYPALGYGVLALAAARRLRWLKPRHDLSYGVYVYGAAVQQVVGTALGAQTAATNFVVSLPAAIALAYASWLLVESPAIRLGRRIVRGGGSPDRGGRTR